MKDLQEGLLLLEDGKEFPGFLFGAPVSAESIKKSASKRDFGYGEVVFNTSMTGYQEILTDPSYYGQIVCMTVPHIGNTGVNSQDPESAHPWCSGFIVHDNCDHPSNWRSAGNLADYLKANKIPGILGVDTRALTRHLRSKGVIRGVILPASEKRLGESLLSELPLFEGRDMIAEVTTREPYHWTKPKTPTYRVVALDFGIKWNLLRNLEKLNCEVEVLPANTSAKEILKRKPHGVFLSNGPGDPTAAPYATETVRELVGQVPVFGVCMGHQILALAMGAQTYKLKFGHRGGNQPVLELDSKKVEISSHNHGYAVDGTSLPSTLEVTHMNLNDKTVEGLVVKGKSAFSVQYHPESCPGPHDSVILFHRFIDNMKNYVSKIS
ncbi:MAG: glutamine-hydrolyzing carbamoyl-phosphate synthase small subunit [Bdellovibrionia bacterium]